MAFEDILEEPGNPLRPGEANTATTLSRRVKVSNPYSSDDRPGPHHQTRSVNKFPHHYRHRPASSGRSSTSRQTYLKLECGRMGITLMLLEVSFRRTTGIVSLSMVEIYQLDSKVKSTTEYDLTVLPQSDVVSLIAS